MCRCMQCSPASRNVLAVRYSVGVESAVFLSHHPILVNPGGRRRMATCVTCPTSLGITLGSRGMRGKKVESQPSGRVQEEDRVATQVRCG